MSSTSMGFVPHSMKHNARDKIDIMQNIFSNFVCFALFFIIHEINWKEENSTWDIRYMYHESKGAILQICIRNKRTTRRDSVTKHRIR